MKKTNSLLAVLMVCMLLLCACGGGKTEMIGPRSKEAWENWEKQQKLLKETWGDTEIYAYVQTIMEDMKNVNRHVVFGKDFSLEKESEELKALQKLYGDMNLEEGNDLEHFHAQLADSSGFRDALGGMLDLDSLTERDEKSGGGYDAVLIYYPSPDTMMAVTVPVSLDENGKFTLRELFGK